APSALGVLAGGVVTGGVVTGGVTTGGVVTGGVLASCVTVIVVPLTFALNPSGSTRFHCSDVAGTATDCAGAMMLDAGNGIDGVMVRAGIGTDCGCDCTLDAGAGIVIGIVFDILPPIIVCHVLPSGVSTPPDSSVPKFGLS